MLHAKKKYEVKYISLIWSNTYSWLMWDFYFSFNFYYSVMTA